MSWQFDMPDTGPYRDRVRRAAFARVKAIYQAVRPKPAQQKVAFIVGCQRSGTTMLSRVFERDLNVRVYGERSELTTQDNQHNIRLNDLDAVRDTVSSVKAPLVVLKPLVESQRVPQLLAEFPGSVAIWIYRDFKDVAFSNRNRFGAHNGIEDIRPIACMDSGDWRSEHASEEVRVLISRFFSDDMNPYDAAVLFWLARNALFFELGLDGRADVVLCKYEDLVAEPEKICAGIYNALSIPFSHKLTKGIHAKSVERGKTITISDEIESLACGMMHRLDRAYGERSGRREIAS